MTWTAMLALLVQAYMVAIIVWVVASWVPSARRRQPLRLLGQLTEPYLRLFRFIPPLGGIDLSPILAIVLLQLLARWLQRLPL